MRKVLVIGVLMAASVAGAVFAATPRAETPADPPKPPAVAAKPADAPQPKGEAKGDEKPVAYTNSPKLRVATDIDFNRIYTTMWSSDGRYFAVRGEAGEKGTQVARMGLYGVHQGKFVRLYERGMQSLNEPVGFTPDSRELIFERREHNLVSGFHWLKYETLPENLEGAEKQVNQPTTRTVNLELPETDGYAFSADGKTFRTVARLRDANGAVTKLEVLEASAETGKVGKSLLKLDFNQHILAPNGKRFAVLDKDYTKVTVYDLDNGAKSFEYAIGEEKFADVTLMAWNVGDGPRKQAEPVMFFSPDARRLVISRAVGQHVILNTETGEALPVLEGTKEARLAPEVHCFSGDGRLLAASGAAHKSVKRRVPGPGSPSGVGGGGGPKELTVWERGTQSLTVWDTQTGKVLKSWNLDRYSPQVMFHPTQPMLAILESNGNSTRVGFWDFAAEAAK